jgi:hypothetical protein
MQGSFDLAIACCAIKSILHIFGSYTMKYLENHFTLKRRIGIVKIHNHRRYPAFI